MKSASGACPTSSLNRTRRRGKVRKGWDVDVRACPRNSRLMDPTDSLRSVDSQPNVQRIPDLTSETNDVLLSISKVGSPVAVGLAPLDYRLDGGIERYARGVPTSIRNRTWSNGSNIKAAIGSAGSQSARRPSCQPSQTARTISNRRASAASRAVPSAMSAHPSPPS